MKEVGSLKGRLLFLLGIALIAVACAPTAAERQWYRGSLHTHSYWSDGDDFPEMIAEWYKSRGYHFLAFSEHNVLLEGEKWLDVDDLEGEITSLEKYRERFGEEWVDERVVDGRRQVRLKQLAEFRPRLEEPGRFLLIPGEEITDTFYPGDDKTDHPRGIPVHLNATNIAEVIRPRGGGSIVETINNNLQAVRRQQERTGRPMLPHLNHPNWRWALTAEEILGAEQVRFFEVHSGDPTNRDEGNEFHCHTEVLWDILITRRVAERSLPPIYGLGTDDAHNYHATGLDLSNPGRAWIMVRSEELKPEALIAAVEAADFYVSTGVTLRDIRHDDTQLTVEILPEAGVTYTTTFHGTRWGYDPRSEPVIGEDGSAIRTTRRYSDAVGQILAVVPGTSVTYTFNGDEIYVRAKVVSSKLKDNPCIEGEKEAAWTQPVIPPARAR